MCGVGGALTIKFRHYFGRTGQEDGSGPDGEITAADLAGQLRGIQQALVGDDESTLVSQLKLTRSDTNDRLDALKRAQTEALQKLSEMGSKTLIEALKDVIRDFNQNITEQFGENFKQLNAAVGKLLVWQDEYKAHMEALTRNVTGVVASMKIASDSYSELVEKSGTFTQVARDLASLLSSLQSQKDHLNIALESLVKLLRSAEGSLPQIEIKVVQLTEQLSNAVTLNQREIDKTLTKNAQAQRDLVRTLSTEVTNLGTITTKQISDFTTQLGTSLQSAQILVNNALLDVQTQVSRVLTSSQESVNKAIEAAQESAAKSVGSSHDLASKALTTNSESIKTAVTANSESVKASVQTATDNFTKMNQDFNRQVSELATKTKEQVTVLDAALSEELKKSLESLGRQLAALSEKFVQDYTPLTEQLHILVETSRQR